MSKNTRRTGAVAAFLGAAALIAPAFANAAPTGSLGSADLETGFTCSVTSTETTANGWGIPFADEKDQTASYSAESVFDTVFEPNIFADPNTYGTYPTVQKETQHMHVP